MRWCYVKICSFSENFAFNLLQSRSTFRFCKYSSGPFLAISAIRVLQLTKSYCSVLLCLHSALEYAADRDTHRVYEKSTSLFRNSNLGAESKMHRIWVENCVLYSRVCWVIGVLMSMEMFWCRESWCGILCSTMCYVIHSDFIRQDHATSILNHSIFSEF